MGLFGRQVARGRPVRGRGKGRCEREEEEAGGPRGEEGYGGRERDSRERRGRDGLAL